MTEILRKISSRASELARLYLKEGLAKWSDGQRGGAGHNVLVSNPATQFCQSNWQSKAGTIIAHGTAGENWSASGFWRMLVGDDASAEPETSRLECILDILLTRASLSRIQLGAIHVLGALPQTTLAEACNHRFGDKEGAAMATWLKAGVVMLNKITELDKSAPIASRKRSTASLTQVYAKASERKHAVPSNV